jgi:1,4-dihydroxy-2-naphthoate octaprenyltransferase
VGLTIFNVILINEFPDYSADKHYSKRNIVVRTGKEKAGIIYVIASVLTWLFFGFSVYSGAPLLGLYIFIPFFLLSAFTVISMLKKEYLDRKKLERLCGMTLVINIGVSLAYIIGIAYGL